MINGIPAVSLLTGNDLLGTPVQCFGELIGHADERRVTGFQRLSANKGASLLHHTLLSLDRDRIVERA